MTILSKILNLFPFHPTPAEEARRLVSVYGVKEALEEAFKHVAFTAAYGAPGEAAYWEDVVHILLAAQKQNGDGDTNINTKKPLD